MVKRILNITGWVVLIAGVFSLMGFAEVRRQSTACKNVTIQIEQNDNNYFITPFEIQKIINLKFGELKLKPVSRINTSAMFKLLKNNPYISKVKEYVTLDGNIEIRIIQKSPVARIINLDNESYYVDSSGYLMPLSSDYTAKTLIVNGDVEEPYSGYAGINLKKHLHDTSIHSMLGEIFYMASYINHNPFWKSQITQIYIDSNKNFNLVPRVGNHIIIFGDTSEIDQKFIKLWAFYKEGLNITGRWDDYSSINLKFKHQIICKKK
jgi:cell division protein FtsQ